MANRNLFLLKVVWLLVLNNSAAHAQPGNCSATVPTTATAGDSLGQASVTVVDGALSRTATISYSLDGQAPVVATVEKYHVHEIEIRGAAAKINPFMAMLDAAIISPQGRTIVVPGFYKRDGIWAVRFSPNMLGEWKYAVRSADIKMETTEGVIRCVENTNANVHGALQVDHEFRHSFIHEDGTRHFMNPYECNWLWALEMEAPGSGKIQEFLDKQIKPFRFNQIRMNIYAHDTWWCPGKTFAIDFGPPALYCWGVTTIILTTRS